MRIIRNILLVIVSLLANTIIDAQNIKYSTISHLQQLNISIPQNNGREKNIKPPYPTIIVIKENDSVNINNNINKNFINNALNEGFAVITIGYRDLFPQCIQDANAAIKWIKANSKKYKIHRDKLFLWGVGYGGNIALIAGISGTYFAGYDAIVDFGSDPEIANAQKNAQTILNNVQIFNEMWDNNNNQILNFQSSNIYNQDTKVLAIINFFAPFTSPWNIPAKLNNTKSKIDSPFTYITPETPAVLSLYASDMSKGTLSKADSLYKKVINVTQNNNLAEYLIYDHYSLENNSNSIINRIFAFINSSEHDK